MFKDFMDYIKEFYRLIPKWMTYTIFAINVSSWIILLIAIITRLRK